MFKNFLIKKMLKSQGVPEEQIDMVLKLVEKNPELFQKIATEAQEKIKSGMNQQSAMMSVMQKYQEDLKKIM